MRDWRCAQSERPEGCLGRCGAGAFLDAECALPQVPGRSEGRNSTSAELESLEETMQQAAEHKAAYAGMPLRYHALDTVAETHPVQTHRPDNMQSACTRAHLRITA